MTIRASGVMTIPFIVRITAYADKTASQQCEEHGFLDDCRDIHDLLLRLTYCKILNIDYLCDQERFGKQRWLL
jgi:hypothetical protein